MISSPDAEVFDYATRENFSTSHVLVSGSFPSEAGMLNRAALLLRYKLPFIDWINGADPSPASHTVTLDEINNDERTVYLLEGVEDETELEEWLALNGETLFEEELEGWYKDLQDR